MPSTKQLLPKVYESLRRSAHWCLAKETPGHSLQTTMLVHEAYLRVDQNGENQEWDSEAHLYGASLIAMRRHLIERARRYQCVKHGAGLSRVDLDSHMSAICGHVNEYIDLRAALERLSSFHLRKAQVVELRFFKGNSIHEISAVLGVSAATVKNDWKFSKAWLKRELSK